MTMTAWWWLHDHSCTLLPRTSFSDISWHLDAREKLQGGNSEASEKTHGNICMVPFSHLLFVFLLQCTQIAWPFHPQIQHNANQVSKHDLVAPRQNVLVNQNVGPSFHCLCQKSSRLQSNENVKTNIQKFWFQHQFSRSWQFLTAAKHFWTKMFDWIAFFLLGTTQKGKRCVIASSNQHSISKEACWIVISPRMFFSHVHCALQKILFQLWSESF